MKKILFTLLFCTSSFAFCDIFLSVLKLENLDSFDTSKFDALNTEEYISKIFYVGEKNPRFELSYKMKIRKDTLQIRLDYPDAWQKFRNGEIDEFSYFGFKLWDYENGKIKLKDFLSELQKYLNHFEN